MCPASVTVLNLSLFFFFFFFTTASAVVVMAGSEENNHLDIREQYHKPQHPFHIPFFSEPKKRSWSELVGFSTQEAVQKIKEEMPIAQVQVMPPNSVFTLDYNPQSVRIFVDASGRVTSLRTSDKACPRARWSLFLYISFYSLSAWFSSG